jgi:hypothetical protein
MSILRFGRWAVLGALVTPALVVGTVFLSTASAQEDGGELLIKVVPPVEEVTEGDEDIVVVVTAENAKNIAAFQYQLEYDPDVLEVATDPATQQPLIQRGDFLGSSGREVACPDPENQPGVLRITCVTLRMEPAGPDGAGTLTTITFKAIGSGFTDLKLDRVGANNPDATQITPISVQSATLDVAGSGGMNWILWGGIGAVVAAVAAGGAGFAAMRKRAGSAGQSTPAS